MSMLAKSLQQPGRGPREWFWSLGFAALIIAVSIGATLAKRMGWVSSPDLGFRLTMALSGAYLIHTGNSIPKTLKPFGCLPHDSVEAQTFRRFAGWMWVSTGLVLALGWCVAPLWLCLIGTLTGVPLAILVVILRRRSLARG